MNYYAKHKDKCYAFGNKASKAMAVNDYKFTPLTSAEAMKEFGYTDSASQRVINCILLPFTDETAVKAYLKGVTQ